MKYGLIGEHLSHSFSRSIHERLSGEPYELREVPRETLGEFLRSEPFKAINVTIPYKQAVIPYLDSLAPSAIDTGAVNVIVRSGDGRLTGHNTDCDGFKALAEEAGVDLSGAKVAVLGSGGAAKAVAAAARDLGAGKLVFAVRRPSGTDQVSIYDTELYNDCDVLVNATPAGMFPFTDERPVSLEDFPNLKGVLDCIYNPLRTNLVLDALQSGIPARGGLRMLVCQAVRAQELFRGVKIDDSVSREVYNELLSKVRNVVLCGMPSSGKTTLGRMLARQHNCPFVDTDDMIVKEAGLSIPEIFAAEGEQGFREREHAAVLGAACMRGAVIAVGGGAVMREDNVRALRQSGIVCLLDRSLGLLEPSADRPLSSECSSLKRLHKQRKSLYLKAADVVIDNNGGPDAALSRLSKLF